MPGDAEAIELTDLIRARPGIWLETHGYIRDTRGRNVRPRLNVLQRRIEAVYLDGFLKGRPVRGIGVKPRKRGFSTGVGAQHYCQLMNHAHEGVIVGDKLDTSEIVFRMMENYAKTDEFIGQHPDWGSVPDINNERIKWPHGSLLHMATASGKATARGMTPQFIHGTEVAHWTDAGETLDGMLNAIPDEGFNVVWLESTAFGTEGPFPETFRAARWPTADECPDGRLYWKQWEPLLPDQPTDATGLAERNFVRVFAAWFEFEESFIRLTPQQKRAIEETLDSESWYDGERELIRLYGSQGPRGMRLGQEVEECDVWEQLAWRRVVIREKCRRRLLTFEAEHPRDPVTCFTASGKKVFDAEGLAAIQIMCNLAKPEHGHLNQTPETNRVVWQPSNADQCSIIRFEPPQEGCHYLISADLCEGEDQTVGDDPDRHSILVLRREYLDTLRRRHKERLAARIKAPNRWPIVKLAHATGALSLFYGGAMVIPEMNNSGLAFIVALQALKFPPPIWTRTEIDPHGTERRHVGWRTTDKSEYKGLRAAIISQLQEAIQQQELVIEDPHLLSELNDFMDKDGRMEAGTGHDDDVLSYAIGHYNIDSATPYVEPVKPDYIPPDLRAALLAEKQGGRGLSMRF